MDLEKFRKLVEQVESMDQELEFFTRASDTDIARVCKALDLELDQQITTYLKAYGGGGLIDELYTNGILEQDPVHDNIYTLVGATLYGRTFYNLPTNYIVISGDFFGRCWVLDSKDPVSNPVYYYNCALQRIENKLYDSFQEYLLLEWQAFVDEYIED